jgi:mannose-binding lectin 1
MRLATSRALALFSLLANVFAAESHPDDPAKFDHNVQEDISFGQHNQKVWGEDHRTITGFALSGDDGHHPDVLSDRIVMTPPWPGNKRASLWADSPEQDAEWAVTMEFRSMGGPQASANMQVWYVKDKKEIGTSSVYTVGKFDGLVIVVDNYGNQGGAIRGFLNDDTKSYKDHHHVDTLSFGHCQFAYRNTGDYVHLEVKQSKDLLEVLANGKMCFKSTKVSEFSNLM